jgi:hypothetical protein
LLGEDLVLRVGESLRIGDEDRGLLFLAGFRFEAPEPPNVLPEELRFDFGDGELGEGDFEGEGEVDFALGGSLRRDVGGSFRSHKCAFGFSGEAVGVVIMSFIAAALLFISPGFLFVTEGVDEGIALDVGDEGLVID